LVGNRSGQLCRHAVVEGERERVHITACTGRIVIADSNESSAPDAG
jgi:hypothetical protein